jgi:hypothetical protein
MQNDEVGPQLKVLGLRSRLTFEIGHSAFFRRSTFDIRHSFRPL